MRPPSLQFPHLPSLLSACHALQNHHMLCRRRKVLLLPVLTFLPVVSPPTAAVAPSPSQHLPQPPPQRLLYGTVVAALLSCSCPSQHRVGYMESPPSPVYPSGGML